jgi:large subunit ribosomal protein L23
MSRLFTRALTTSGAAHARAGPSIGLPLQAVASQAASAPLAVRERREQFPHAQRKSLLVNPTQFEGGAAWPEHLEKLFQKMRRAGQYKGDETSARKAFLKVNQAWRSRVRGGTTGDWAGYFAAEGAPKAGDAVPGQKIWLPNITVRLVRNSTKAGQAYDPWTATFRIPPGMTKNDLRSYLFAVYGLEVTFIRTELRVGTVERNRRGQKVRLGGADNHFKRAVVGLKEPFHYPDDVEEMRAGTFGGKEAGEAQAQARELMLNGEFLVDGAKDFQKAMLMKIMKGQRWRGKTTANAVSRAWASTLTAGQHYPRDCAPPQRARGGPRRRGRQPLHPGRERQDRRCRGRRSQGLHSRLDTLYAWITLQVGRSCLSAVR